LVEEPTVRTVLDLFRLAIEPQRAAELLPSLLTSFLGGGRPPQPRGARGRAAAFGALLGGARGWVRLEADRAFWELWRSAPAFRRLVARVSNDPTDRPAPRHRA